MRKIMTITLEFDLGERKIYPARLKAGYAAAAAAATAALKAELLENSVGAVQTRMAYDYRWAEVTECTGPTDIDWENEETDLDTDLIRTQRLAEHPTQAPNTNAASASVAAPRPRTPGRTSKVSATRTPSAS